MANRKYSNCSEEKFLKDVAAHDMQVLRDDGAQRHLRFKRKGTSCYHFDIITWPGYLCYTGDMGTFVFSRMRDMFEFFRMEDHDMNKSTDGLSINPGYWSEKLIATDKNGGHEEWDAEEFIRRVNEVRVGWMREAKDLGVSKEERRELWEAVEGEVLSDPNNEMLCVVRIYEFNYRADMKNEFGFQDFFDCSMSRYTFRFLWCCYALAWGIGQYDKRRHAKLATI